MAILEITNISPSGEAVHLGDLYTSVAHGKTLRVERAAADLSRMPTLQEAVARKDVTLTISYTPAEIESGVPALFSTVEAQDASPVAESTVLAVPVTIYKKLKQGSGGADDVEIVPPGALPSRLRLLDCTFCVVNPAGSVELRDAPAGGGSLLASLDTSFMGRTHHEGHTSMVEPAKGIYVRRSDSSLVGELVLLGRYEL